MFEQIKKQIWSNKKCHFVLLPRWESLKKKHKSNEKGLLFKNMKATNKSVRKLCTLQQASYFIDTAKNYLFSRTAKIPYNIKRAHWINSTCLAG